MDINTCNDLVLLLNTIMRRKVEQNSRPMLPGFAAVSRLSSAAQLMTLEQEFLSGAVTLFAEFTKRHRRGFDLTCVLVADHVEVVWCATLHQAHTAHLVSYVRENLPAAIDTAVEQQDRPANNTSTERRAAVDAYIAEVFQVTGKRITRTDIWKWARYKSRTEFERWERNDPQNPNKTAHEHFTRILKEKPHLR